MIESHNHAIHFEVFSIKVWTQAQFYFTVLLLNCTCQTNVNNLISLPTRQPRTRTLLIKKKTELVTVKLLDRLTRAVNPGATLKDVNPNSIRKI